MLVINYNGGELTLRCLRSVLKSDWPAEALRVVLVDNGPHDGVAAAVRQEMPTVDVVEPGRNLGFAGGCNLGLDRLHDVTYVALLNNDAWVDPSWLQPLVAALESDPTVGAACPKILFDDSFVELSIRSPVEAAGSVDHRQLGAAVGGVRTDGADAGQSVQFVSGFWGIEHRPPDGNVFRWTTGDAMIRVPARPDRTLPACALRLWATSERTVVLSSGTESLEHIVGPEPGWVDVPLSGEPFDVINNVGSAIVARGWGADRGYLERDAGQYERTEEVFAWCGAAVLLPRRYLDAVGTFCERFFLYYEDFDLAWRGRAQGWRYLYVPGVPVRHVHSASAVEGSRLHHYYSDRNGMLTLTRNAPVNLAARAIGRHLWDTAYCVRRDLILPLAHRRPPAWETVRRRSTAFAAYLAALAPTLAERRRLRRRQQVSDAELLRWLERP